VSTQGTEPNTFRHPRVVGNALRIAETLRAYGPRTRAELVTLTGLSRPTVSSALIDLIGAGMASETATRSTTKPAGGRPPSVVRLTREAGVAVGVDIGRRHVRVAVADLGHTVLGERATRTTFESDDRPIEVLSLAATLIDQALADLAVRKSDVVGVGLGIPAPITRDGTIGSPALLPAWAPLRPSDELAGRIDLPVRVENDANLGALGEYVWGAGRGCADLVYLKLATGIGAGIVLDGRLYRGAAGTAGEFGHVALDVRGPVCRCGNRGCVELSAGGRALLAHARVVHPELTDLAGLIRYAEAGDQGCRRLLIDAGTQLGFALGSLVNLLNPQRIVLGGELGAAAHLMHEPLHRGLAETAMAAAVSAVDIVRTDLGTRAAALGGVALALGIDTVALATA